MLIAAIIFLILAVIGLMAVLIWKCSGDKEATSIRQKEGKDRKVYISNKGVNADSGNLGGSSGEMFKGTSREKMPTMVLSGELASIAGNGSSRHTICLRNINNGGVFQGNFVKEIKIGRAVTGNGQSPVILLPFSSVSRIHCRVFAEGEKVYVEDLNSSYGTFVNNIRVLGAVPLHKGDSLTLGYEKFYVEI